MHLRIGQGHEYPDKHPYYPFCDYTVWDLELVWDPDWHESITEELARDSAWADTDVPRAVYVGTNQYILQLCETITEHRTALLDFVNQHQPELFFTRWPRGLDFYKTHAKIYSKAYRDRPGFSLPPHVDHQHIMVQVIINLADNNGTGTDFHSVMSAQPWYKAQSQRCQGSMFINGPGAIHSLTNGSNFRYIIYTSIESE